MIITQIENLGLYLNDEARIIVTSFFKNLDKNIPVGETSLKGSEIFAKSLEYTTTLNNNNMVEAHNQYVDIQYTISGEEKIQCYTRSELQTRTAYSDESDCEFFFPKEEAQEATIFLKNNLVAVLFPQDAHLAALNVESDSNFIKKIVIKINEKYFTHLVSKG